MCLLNASTTFPPSSKENICAQAASNQSYYFHRVGSAWGIHLDGFYMPFHAGVVASHIQLVAIEFRSYTATTKGSCRPFCCVLRCVLAALNAYHSAIFPMDNYFMLVHTCSSRFGNQYSTNLVVGDIWFNMTTSSCCCYNLSKCSSPKITLIRSNSRYTKHHHLIYLLISICRASPQKPATIMPTCACSYQLSIFSDLAVPHFSPVPFRSVPLRSVK